jgi:hypothetical protein
MLEKRRHERRPIKLEVLFHKLGQLGQKVYKGQTVNVSTGGLLFETTHSVFQPGELLSVYLHVPPTNGLLEFGGRIRGFARVVRTSGSSEATDEPAEQRARFTVAVQFCRCPTLSV